MTSHPLPSLDCIRAAIIVDLMYTQRSQDLGRLRLGSMVETLLGSDPSLASIRCSADRKLWCRQTVISVEILRYCLALADLSPPAPLLRSLVSAIPGVVRPSPLEVALVSWQACCTCYTAVDCYKTSVPNCLALHHHHHLSVRQAPQCDAWGCKVKQTPLSSRRGR